MTVLTLLLSIATARIENQRVSCEIRGLIMRMGRENFLWGAQRIHGELLMLGFKVSQATVSRYLPAPGGRPTQSWRTFLRNQAIAFDNDQYPEEYSDTEHLSQRHSDQTLAAISLRIALPRSQCAEALCTMSSGRPRFLIAHGKRAATAFQPPFR